MFSVEYFNKAVIITAYNIRRINFRYLTNLRKILIQVIRKPCNKVILNLVGVRQIDSITLEMLKNMKGIIEKSGKRFYLLNLDAEIVEQINTNAGELSHTIAEPAQMEEYIGLMEV